MDTKYLLTLRRACLVSANETPSATELDLLRAELEGMSIDLDTFQAVSFTPPNTPEAMAPEVSDQLDDWLHRHHLSSWIS